VGSASFIWEGRSPVGIAPNVNWEAMGVLREGVNAPRWWRGCYQRGRKPSPQS
jgi:hypothetical protein